MENTSFRFTIGSYECVAIFDGYDGSMPASDTAQFLFKNAPKESLTAALHTYNFPLDQYTECFTCLFVKTDQHNVLVDTGLGVTHDSPGTGQLIQNMKTEGIDPDEIDSIIISHAHGDHIGGITDVNGEPIFRQAKYYMRKEEWNFWTSQKTLANPANKWMIEFVEKKLKPVQESFCLLEHDTEIIPGIKTLFTPGHTPGNMSLSIQSGDEQLLYLGDLVLHPVQIGHPNWYSEVDIQPRKNVQNRRLLYQLAASKHSLVFAYHFDFPCLGYINQQGKNWSWQPL